MSSILVTGGAGFIGSHLCDRLLADGHAVTVLDDLSSGSVANLDPEVDLRVGSIHDPDAVARATREIDACFHLAAISSVARSCLNWQEVHQINLGGSVLVLEALKRARVPLVFASSAAVYGDQPDLPLAEHLPFCPLSPYGADKAALELHALAGARCFGLGSIGLRFFNVYGPRQDPRSPYSGVISLFAERIASAQSLTVHGDGEQVRDFIYVADVIEALLAAMAAVRAGECRVFNVCTGRPTSVMALAQALQREFGREVELCQGAARVGDIRTSLGDPAACKAGLGFSASTELAEGLARLRQAQYSILKMET